jgi:hypothetical protein
MPLIEFSSILQIPILQMPTFFVGAVAVYTGFSCAFFNAMVRPVARQKLSDGLHRAIPKDITLVQVSKIAQTVIRGISVIELLE